MSSDDLNAVIDDLEVVEDKITSELDNWKLRDDMVAIDELYFVGSSY